MNAPAVKSTSASSKNDGYHYISDGHATTGFQKMHAMQRQGKLCDVIITVGEEVYRGHKIVFATMSEYFSNLFDIDEQTANCEVHIDDISPISLNSILQFLYTGEILITVVNVEELILTSNKFMIESLASACREALPTLINPLTWAKIKAIAGAQMYKELYQICHSYSLKHFEEIIKTHTFVQLPFSVVKELIADDELQVSSEEDVYSAILNWVKHDLPNRNANLSELMSYVKFPLIDKTYMMKNVFNEPLLTNNNECTRLLLEASKYHLGMQCDETSRIQPRKHFKGQVPYIFVTGGELFNKYSGGELFNFSQLFKYSVTSECEMYNPRTNTWHAFSPMKNRRSHHGLVGFKSLLYAFGGHDQNTLSSVEYYDPLKDSWDMTTPMPKGRYEHGVCSTDNSIYICGGQVELYNYLNNVDKFDPVSGVYLTSQPMKNERRSFNMAVSDNCIYAIGGYSGNLLNSMEIYDPREGKWADGPSMITPRQSHAVTVSDGYIYVSPGSGTSWERFNIRGSKWEPLNVCNEQGQLNQHGCCYFLGSTIFSLEKFNPKENSVLEMPPMLNNRALLSATIMDCFEIKHS